jgi:negative regulator of genetic competence, sporulation and motility
MSNSIEYQNLFVDILNQAENEVGFSTKDCKILIEALASSDGTFVFTITKYETTPNKRKKLSIKKKDNSTIQENAIYVFNTFDEFCNYCSYINNANLNNLNGLSTNISLYVYNDKYYLVFKDLNLSFKNLRGFYASITEFGKSVSYSESFESKIIEHGKIVMKKSAIKKCIQYFV